MSAPRSRKEEKIYKKYRKNRTDNKCQFCRIGPEDTDQFVKATRSFKIIRNIFNYSIWDGQKVEDHLMVLPKQHIDTLAHLSEAEGAELVKILGEYEGQGYNSYARAPRSVIKSVVHQHTHLIKTGGGPKTFLFLLRRPLYIRFVK